MGIAAYVDAFFSSFEMRADKKGAHSYGSYLLEAIRKFLKDENAETAFEVYSFFFDCYRIKLRGSVSFIDLLDTLQFYEENAATLTDKQRDHYIHSVNVFLLGLSIYAANGNYSACFEKSVFEGQKYAGGFDCAQEEFLFRWGITALFHDIGYPVEIMYNQLKKFIRFVTHIDSENDAKPFIEYGHFKGLDSIAELMWREDFLGAFSGETELDFYSPVDLLVHGVCRSLPVDPEETKKALRGYLKQMQSYGFVDHGFYSAIVILKWYGYLIQKSGQSSEILFYPVLDAASAILLHNCYRNMFMKPPFSLSALDAEKHPLAYLLILCDELQEWNRKAYGALDKTRILPQSTDVRIDGNELRIHYETLSGTLAESFGKEKEDFLSRVLSLMPIFPQSISVTCTTKVHLYINAIREREGHVLPRPLLENLEQMAITIHENYNKAQLERYPERELDYPTWDSLPETLKFSNIRQAKGVFEKLRAVGCICSEEPAPEYEEVAGFTPDELEMLAKLEHERWNEERLSDGWKYAPEKNVEAKLSPYIVPYEILPEDIKDYDRDAVKNIFPVLRQLGLRVYRAI